MPQEEGLKPQEGTGAKKALVPGTCATRRYCALICNGTLHYRIVCPAGYNMTAFTIQQHTFLGELVCNVHDKVWFHIRFRVSGLTKNIVASTV